MSRHAGSEGSDHLGRPDTPRGVRGAPVPVASRVPGSAQGEALRLQRSAGNRAVVRMLSRWAAHPDQDKKGQFVSDQMAADWNRFNPPLSK